MICPADLVICRTAPAVRHTAAGHQALPYGHLICFDYNIDLNPGRSWLLRSIRDYVGLPNAGDYELFFGKAYLQISSSLRFFASFFILGRPRPDEHT